MRLLPRRIDRKTITRLLGSLASLVLLLYLLSKQGWGEILLAIRSIPTATLMAVLVLLVVSRVAISARWYSLLRTTDTSIPFREAVRLTLAGLFAANFLPTTIGGDVVRAAGVARISHDRVGSVSSIVVDRLIGMLGMAMVLPIGSVWACRRGGAQGSSGCGG
ncbi:MAG: putative rane protein [Anaerolineales bacterium]|nr:putative rane protein [Anaerolineales bacterium]